MKPGTRKRSAGLLLGVLAILLAGQAPARSDRGEPAGLHAAGKPAPADAAGEPAPIVPLPVLARDLAALGIATTGGAAPGYVEDRACSLCHTQIAAGYAGKGMARAFS